MGTPQRACPQKEDLAVGGVSVGQARLLDSPGTDGSSGSGVAVAAGAVLFYHVVATNASSIWQRGILVEMHQGNNFTESAKLVIETLLGR